MIGLLAVLSSPGSGLAPILIPNNYQAPLPAELLSPPSSPTRNLLCLSLRSMDLKPSGCYVREGLCISFPPIPHHSATFLCYDLRRFLALQPSFPLFQFIAGTNPPTSSLPAPSLQNQFPSPRSQWGI